jgi:hypothetical protein
MVNNMSNNVSNNITNGAEEIVLKIVDGLRFVLMPFFDKYSVFYKYINYIFYLTYAVILFGFYNATPEYIPVLRNATLYIAIFLLLLRFNSFSWNNPKYSVLGGNNFTEFDRKLIISVCIFIVVTHFVSDSAENYAKLRQQITQPVNNIINIDTTGGDHLPSIKHLIGNNAGGVTGAR